MSKNISIEEISNFLDDKNLNAESI